MEELTNEERQELQRVLINLEQMKQAGEEIRSQIEVLSNRTSEFEGTIRTVEGVEGLDEGTEILIPVGSDSYLKSRLTEPNKVLSGLGADLVAERESEEGVEALNRQKEEVEKAIEKLRREIGKINKKIEELSPKAEKLLAKAKKSGEEPVV